MARSEGTTRRWCGGESHKLLCLRAQSMDIMYSYSNQSVQLHSHFTSFFARDHHNNMCSFSHLTKEDLDGEGAVAILSRFLHDVPHDYIFGLIDNATTAAAKEQSKLRTSASSGAALISVYVVNSATDTVTAAVTIDQNLLDQEELLSGMWNVVPSRFFVIGKDAFLPNGDTTTTTTMRGTADQLTILTGAVHLHGRPALVFDARRGMPVTYSLTDSDGTILQVGTEIYAFNGRSVIREWLDKTNFSSTPNFNANRWVLCTGGNGCMIKYLIQPLYDGGGVNEHDGETAMPRACNSGMLLTAPRYTVELSEHIIHYGIACVLVKQALRRRNGSNATPQPLLLVNADTSLGELPIILFSCWKVSCSLSFGRGTKCNSSTIVFSSQLFFWGVVLCTIPTWIDFSSVSEKKITHLLVLCNSWLEYCNSRTIFHQIARYYYSYVEDFFDESRIFNSPTITLIQ